MTTAAAGPRRRIDRGLLLASLAIAAGIVIIAWGALNSITGEPSVRLPDGLERVSPAPGSPRVLAQENIVAELEQGYTGVFVINGVEIETLNLDEVGTLEVEPGRQIDLPAVTIFEPGNATLTYRPQRGSAIEEFSNGPQEVQVIFWRLDEGRIRPLSFTWTFDVF